MFAIPRRRMGRSDLELTELSLGAAFIGGREDPLLDDPAQATRRMDGVAVATVQRALELGITHIDTSPLYEPSERRIGMALAEVEAPGLTISTKVGSHRERRHSYTAADIRWSLEQSLKLLGRDRVDIVLIHDPPTMDPVFKSGDGFDALDKLRDEGLLDYVGLGARDIPYHRAAIESGRVDVILTFADYNLVRRQASGLIDQAAAAGVGVLLGSPQMLGLLAKGDPRVTARKAGYGYFPAEDVRGRGRVVGLVPGARGGVSSPEYAVRAGPAGDQRGAVGGGDARRRLRRTCGRRGRGFPTRSGPRRWRGWRSWTQAPPDFPEFVAMENWVERVIGDRIRLRKMRWNTSIPAWQVEGIVSLSSGERLDVQVPKGTTYEMPGRELWISDHGENLSFERDAWSHVMHAVAPGVHWYCNVTTPPAYRSGALTWTDLGIDVEVYPDGEIAVDDLPEFLEVREALPADDFARAVQATRRLLEDGAAGRPPFQATGGSPAWVEQKLFWLAPGRGDGLAAVGEAAHTRQPEVVERVLSTGRPSALTGLGAGALMGLAETAAPRDGVTVLVADTELAAGLESIRFLLQVWGPGLHVRLVLVRDEAGMCAGSLRRRCGGRNGRRRCGWLGRW